MESPLPSQLHRAFLLAYLVLVLVTFLLFFRCLFSEVDFPFAIHWTINNGIFG